MEVKDETIQHLRASLNLAFQLMTSYQRERHKRLSMRSAPKSSTLKKTGRPKAFHGHIPGHDRSENVG